MTPSIGKRKDSVVCFARLLAKPLLSPFFQIETRGEEYLPKEAPFILLPKHQRWEDIPLLSLATPRPLYYIAKHELFNNPISGWFLSALGGIPLNRFRPMESRQSLKSMIDYLGVGEGIVIFPEGTYYRNKVGPGHVGMIRLVRSRFTVPFIPVGLRYIKVGGRWLVRVHFGRHLSGDASVAIEAFLDKIMKEITRLSGF